MEIIFKIKDSTMEILINSKEAFELAEAYANGDKDSYKKIAELCAAQQNRYTRPGRYYRAFEIKVCGWVIEKATEAEMEVEDEQESCYLAQYCFDAPYPQNDGVLFIYELADLPEESPLPDWVLRLRKTT